MDRLVTISDIYGRRHRVSFEELQGTKTQLFLYNQFGRRLADTPGNLKKAKPVTIHRANINPTSCLKDMK